MHKIKLKQLNENFKVNEDINVQPLKKNFGSKGIAILLVYKIQSEFTFCWLHTCFFCVKMNF